MTRTLAALCLAACTPAADLTGTWTGELACTQQAGSADYDLTVDLTGENGTFDGPLAIAYEEDFTADGQTTTVAFEATGTLVVDADAEQAQELVWSRNLRDLVCRFDVDGVQVSEDCADLALTVQRIGQDVDLGALSWDGEDTITIQSSTCDGALLR
jgi:hypothetical protein